MSYQLAGRVAALPPPVAEPAPVIAALAPLEELVERPVLRRQVMQEQYFRLPAEP